MVTQGRLSGRPKPRTRSLCLATLPFSDEIRAALVHREGPKVEPLNTVVAYERGEFPADHGSLNTACGEAVEWAGGATRAAA